MRVRQILGEEGNQDSGKQFDFHPIFSEMEEYTSELGTEGEWKETARYDDVKCNRL